MAPGTALATNEKALDDVVRLPVELLSLIIE
jgi:hypothetical protein